MLFGKQHEFRVTYNGEAVEVVQSYRYLGNVVQHIQKQNGDIYSNTHEHLSEKVRKAWFSLQHRLRQFNDISPSIMCNMYEALVSPVLTYGSGVWGHLKVCRDAADSVFFKYMKSILKVKSSTSHVAVLGECGQLPPSVLCHINVLCFYNRLQNLDSKCIVRVIFDELQKFHEMGFNNWITKVNELALKLNIDLHCTDTNLFKMYCKTIVKNDFTRRWAEELCDVEIYPKLRMYRTIKHSFGREPYIDLVSDARYRVAVTKIRTSSHPLEIERGRHTNA